MKGMQNQARHRMSRKVLATVRSAKMTAKVVAAGMESPLFRASELAILLDMVL